MTKKTVDDLRDLLFSAIEGVKSGALEVEKAKVIGDLSQVMVNSANAEVNYARATGQQLSSSFLGELQPVAKPLPKPEEPPKPALPPGYTGVTVHKIT